VNFNFEQFERAKNIKIPSICEELAEDIGIQIGDGSIGYWKNSKGGKSHIVETYGNLTEDEIYLIKFVKPLKEKLYGVHVSHHKNKSAGTIINRTYSKNLVFFYKNLGLPIGKKIDIKIPRFILENKELQIACLRGLMDTDGSLSFSKGSHKCYSNPTIHFTTKSKSLTEQVCKILTKMGFSYTAEFDSKQHDYRTNKIYIKNNIYISGKKNLEKWMKIVGFNNIVQMSRYHVYKKLGYCLPKTTLQQRLEILEK
jgi:intein/homing endonuclease